MENDNPKYNPEEHFGELMSIQELLVDTMVKIEALVQILQSKGITDQEELKEMAERIRKDLDERIRRNSWEN